MLTDARSRCYKHNCSALYPVLVLLPFSLWAQRPIHHHRRLGYSWSATFHFCALHPSTGSQHPVSQQASPCQPSAVLFPPGLGISAEKWSRRKGLFDRRMNYSTAIRRLSSRLLLSIKIKLLQRKLKRHSSFLLNKSCYLGPIYIADTAIMTQNKKKKRKALYWDREHKYSETGGMRERSVSIPFS